MSPSGVRPPTGENGAVAVLMKGVGASACVAPARGPMRMGLSSPILVAGFLVAAGALAAVIVVRARATTPGGVVRAAAGTKPRRAGGSSWLVLQEFVDPRAQHVEQVPHERRVEADPSGDDDEDVPESALRAGLLASLGGSPVDPDEIRRHLAAAHRAGLDWRRLYDEAVRATLADRPYRAPSLPPASRVAPRVDLDDDD